MNKMAIAVIIMVCHASGLPAQKVQLPGVKIDQLAKVNMKFYLADSFPNPYSGEAYDLYPGPEKKISLYYKIKNGETIKFIIYSESGNILTEANFDDAGVYSGNYFSGNEKGDTLSFGTYKAGLKTGRWIETDSASVKKIIVY